MATLVFVHAHPDDEASQTSGSMARAVEEGHRVVLVYATNGDQGMAASDIGDATVPEYRRREAECSAAVIGTSRVHWLGYADSGMRGWPANDAPDSLHRADRDHAALKIAHILDEEQADVVVGYDWHGGYGHPDHVRVHDLTRRALDFAARPPRYLEQTTNRDAMRLLVDMMGPAGSGEEFSPDQPMDDGNPMGTPESEISYRVDLRDRLGTKRAALACHASQTSDVGMMLGLPDEVFEAWFGYEYYIDPAQPPGMRDAWPFSPDPATRGPA